MTSEELLDKLNEIQKLKCETQILELKSAEKGCPKRLYDTLSSFSNQDSGGIIVFGIDSIKGSFIRVGDSDEPMTEYEIYSYEAFRKKYQDDIREVYRATFSSLNQAALTNYIEKLKTGKPNLSYLSDSEIYELMSITRNQNVTLSSAMLFNPYPQAYFPQLCVIATSIPGKSIGETGEMGERFLDNERIEGNIPEMLERAIQFVRRNMKTKTIINPKTGQREDRTDYPLTAVREALLNALVHRLWKAFHNECYAKLIVMQSWLRIPLKIKESGTFYFA